MARKDIITTSAYLLEKLSSLSSSELEELIIYHNKKYFTDAAPEISDEAFDKLVEALKFIKPQSLVLNQVGHEAFGREVTHLRPMLSLDKCYDDESFFKWAEKIHGDLIAMPKIDGIASSLIYSAQGDLVQASTRGDGLTGEDITQNIRMISDIITKLSKDIIKNLELDSDYIEIRGEVFLPLSRFNQEYAQEFANARNLAAGALKQKDMQKSKRYGLKFLPYDLRGFKLERESDKFILLERLNFSAMPWRLLKNDHEATTNFSYFQSRRAEFDFELDGVVFRANERSDQVRLGETAHHPRYALAYKFQGESAATELLGVEWSVSRSGAITPVAIIKPVFISGAQVSRASLHNLGIFLQHDLREHSLVEVIRRGGVIPHVERVLSKHGEALSVPTTCPSCHSLVEVNGDFLYCSAKQACRAVVASALIHFCSVLNIEGLGEKLIYKLLHHGLCVTFKDIFVLTVADLLTLDRMGDVLAHKLIQEIARKREIELAVFLRALGINEVGINASELVASNFHTLKNIRALSVEDLIPIHGIGARIAESLVAGLAELRPQIDDLLTLVHVKDYENRANSFDQDNFFFNKSVVFTGKMAHLDRKAAQALVKSLGGTAPGAISSATDFLVIGDEKSALRGEGQKSTKQKEAEKLINTGSALKIISESEFLRLSQKNTL
jgi:DNA ligase (NAD+)